MFSNVMTLGGENIRLDEESLQNFTNNFEGEILLPGDPRYDDVRQVWNGMIDKRPALIARCVHAGDVKTAVDFSRENNILGAVRGGGHNVTGSAVCEGGMMIDLSLMKDIEIDPDRRIARAGPGVTWAEMDQSTQTYGLATPGGVVSMTGIAGLTLGGGFGWLRRKHGLTCDNLILADVVTADGDMITASEKENSELFWGLRGGGGNFGIVTDFVYRLHPIGPELMFDFVLYPIEKGRKVLQFYREFTANAPEEVSSFAICGTVPAEDLYPPESHGEDYILLAACYAGPVEDGKRILKPLQEIDTPIVDFSEPMPYIEIQTILDEDYPAGELQYYWKSLFLDGLDDPAIDRILELAAERPSSLSTVDVWHMGGAIEKMDLQDTAFGDRSSPYLLGIESNWESPQENEKNIRWTRQAADSMQEFSTGGSYLNFEELGEEHTQAALNENYQRLVDLKNQYDPENFFRLNQNIQPDGGNNR